MPWWELPRDMTVQLIERKGANAISRQPQCLGSPPVGAGPVSSLRVRRARNWSGLASWLSVASAVFVPPGDDGRRPPRKATGLAEMSIIVAPQERSKPP